MSLWLFECLLSPGYILKLRVNNSSFSKKFACFSVCHMADICTTMFACRVNYYYKAEYSYVSKRKRYVCRNCYVIECLIRASSYHHNNNWAIHWALWSMSTAKNGEKFRYSSRFLHRSDLTPINFWMWAILIVYQNVNLLLKRLNECTFHRNPHITTISESN